MNRPLPRGDCRRGNPDPGRPSRLAGNASGVGVLVGGTAVDRREATPRAVNVIKHGGFERRRTNPAILENVAPLETLCATSVGRKDRLGLCC
jgi:hypothetical protein